jgi:predicted nucleic-acid-binding protein
MRGLDADVLACYVRGEEAAQFAAADAVIERARADGEKLYVTGLALCRLGELLCVHNRSTIADLLDRLLHLELFEVENRPLALRALERYRTGGGNFGDYLMAEIGKRAGCRDMLTLNGLLTAERGFTTPSAS